MTQKFALKSIFFKLFLLVGVFSTYTSALCANSESAPIVLGYTQRIAVETLFRYCAMEKNPFYVEREKRMLLQEAKLKKILEKRGEDLTPFQQIDLLKHTFDLRFADKITAQTVKAFMVAWIVLEGAELFWRSYCQLQHRKFPDGGWFEKKVSVGIKIDPSTPIIFNARNRATRTEFGGEKSFDPNSGGCSVGGDCYFSTSPLPEKCPAPSTKPSSVHPPTPTRGKMPDDRKDSCDDCSPDGQESEWRSKDFSPKPFGWEDALSSEFANLFSPLRKRLADTVFKIKKNYAKGKQNVDTYGFEILGEPIKSSQLSPDVEREQRKDLSATFRGSSKYPFSVTFSNEYKAKPRSFKNVLLLLNYGIKLWPILMLVAKKTWGYFRGASLSPEIFLDRLFKNFSSEYVAGFGGKGHRKYLLDVLIAPLWQKHGGDEDKICADLSEIGTKLRKIEVAVASGESSQKTLYTLVMGVHGGVLPFEHTKLMGRINQAFEHGIVHRGLKAGFATFAVVSLHVLVKALVKFRISENLVDISKYSLPLFMSLFTYWTIKECVVKAWNYDSLQARKDYDVFLKRLDLENTPQYKESFYWAWFFPMWRTHKRDVLEVELCFFNRVDEVKKLFDARVVEI